ncbi:uncharacterized protein LOC110117584 [Ceratitis capitata]|uniref:uncharacterized protein LOC110117584 n=1 Tax=Ceratitis capitata TaxID=7213 RepID=UPI000A121B32|nr:uncharacterized protein LOC110117584 [Ceratitis capitata]
MIKICNGEKQQLYTGLSLFLTFIDLESHTVELRRKTNASMIFNALKHAHNFETVAICRTQKKDSVIQLSKKTTAGCLVESGFMTKIQRKRRVDFAHSHWCWTLSQSKYVVWNYDTKNKRIGPDGRRPSAVYRFSGYVY